MAAKSKSPNTRDIAAAIAGRHGMAGALAQLERELSASELGSLLMHVLRERSRQMSWSDVRRVAERDPLFRPSDVDARVTHQVEGAALEACDGFQVLELSPVSVLGANALAGIDQNNVLSATRQAEVLADPTTALAVECARRRKAGNRQTPTKLAASTRLIRLQPFDDPGFSRHFRLFSLVSAGRDLGDERFERQALREHLTVWLRLAEELSARGFGIRRVRLDVSDTRLVRALLRAGGFPLESLKGHVSPSQWPAELARRGIQLPGLVDDPTRIAAPSAEAGQLLERLQKIRTDVLEPLQTRFPRVRMQFDLSRLHGLHYYQGPVLHVHLTNAAGQEFPLGDGGLTSWTQALLADRKERLFCSAFGTELLCRLFR